MHSTRRARLFAAAAAATVLLPGGVAAHAADDFPAKPVTLVTPFAAGSGPDAAVAPHSSNTCA